MLNFEFTDEQKAIAQSIRDFGKKEIKPVIRKMEEEEKIPDKIIKGIADMGLMAMTVSQQYGGIEADPITVGIAAEELARADISCAIPTFFLVPSAWGYVFDKYANERCKEDLLPNVTKGNAFLGIAATEPDAGTDLGNTRTTAVKKGDKWVINGEKMFISGVRESMEQMPEGGGYVAIFKTDPSKGTRGMSLFYLSVNKNVKGLRPTYLKDWGRKGISTGGMAFEDVEIPAHHLIGEENKGFYRLVEGFDYARAIIAVICASAAQSALEHAMEYIKIRKTFGQPIGKYEGVQFKLAEHWSKLDALRLLGYKALWLKGREGTKDDPGRFAVTKACSEAKMLGPQWAFEAINDAIQWFGAFGYTEECPLDLALKGVRSYWWAEGALEVQKLIVARELLGKEYVANK